MKKKIAVLLILVFVLSTCNISQVQAKQKDNGKGIANEEIEEILENVDDYSVEPLSKSELNDFFNTKNANVLIGKTEEEIARYFATVDINGGNTKKVNGVISNPVKYLQDNVAKKSDKYTLVKQKEIYGVGARTCNGFGGGNNCTLTALYNLMVYYRDKRGYKKIPTDSNKVYKVIKEQAIDLGYTTSSGLVWYHNDNLVKNTLRKGFKYKSGDGYNEYGWDLSSAIQSLDHNNPFMFSIGNGTYYNHTVTVFGYKTYKNNRTKKKYTFLMIRNGLNGGTTYLPWKGLNPHYIGVMTYVVEP